MKTKLSLLCILVCHAWQSHGAVSLLASNGNYGFTPETTKILTNVGNQKLLSNTLSAAFAPVDPDWLSEASTILGPEQVAIRQDGQLRKATLDQVKAFTGGGGDSSLVYRAVITQVGTAAPTTNVFENTVGNIVWSRNSAGSYSGTLAGALTPGKTLVFLGNNNSTLTTLTVLRGWAEPDVGDTIEVRTVTYAVDVDTLVVSDADGLLLSTPIEIRVYP